MNLVWKGFCARFHWPDPSVLCFTELHLFLQLSEIKKEEVIQTYLYLRLNKSWRLATTHALPKQSTINKKLFLVKEKSSMVLINYWMNTNNNSLEMCDRTDFCALEYREISLSDCRVEGGRRFLPSLVTNFSSVETRRRQVLLFSKECFV